jgi:hypothetical protein
MQNRLLSPKEIMQRYGISRTTLIKWIRELSLPAFMISHSHWNPFFFQVYHLSVDRIVYPYVFLVSSSLIPFGTMNS